MIARIAEHRRLAWVVEEIAVRMGKLDAELPPDRMKGGSIVGTRISASTKDDDPR
jgi:hypothetical protein